MANTRLLIPLGLTLVLAAPAWGQPSSPIDTNRVDRQQPTIPDPANAEKQASLPGAAAEVETDETSAPDIRKIEFVGTDVPLVVAQATQVFVGRPATRANLKAMTDAMSEAYGRSDVALFTIVVPKQDFAEGALKVYVAEGHLQSVLLTGEVEGRKLKLVKTYAEKLTREKPTSRRRLERYLSLIRDIPGLKTDARLELGQGPGAVRMVLALDYQRPRFTMGVTNRTSSLVRDGEIEAKGVIYSTFREGDLTEVNALASLNFKDELYFGLSHSTPIGTEGGRLGLAYGHLETRPRGTAISGNADTLGLNYSYPVIRGYRRNLTATASLDGVNSSNAAFGSIIASERTRAARAALGYSFVGKRRVLNGGLTLSKGLDLFGARVADGRAKATFFKANLRAGLNQAVGKRGVLRLSASGQWTRDPLPAVERFSVGGDPYGRAFETSLIAADRGIAGSAELAFRPLKKGPLAASEVYGFVDYAVVDVLSRPGFIGRDFDLGSAGGGLRLGYKDNAMIGLEVANTIDRPYAAYDSEWRFSINWRVSFKP
jgi:hemolysin activation/secretion protein